MARRDAQGSLERRERVGVAVEHPQRHSAGEVRVHVPRIDRQDAVEAGDRLLRPAEPGEDESALEQRLRMLRSERRDAVEGRKRLRRAVEIVQAKPEIEERVRRRRVDLQGRRDEARALLVARLLAFEDAEMMQRLEMLRRAGEDVAIELLGLCELALLMQRERALQTLFRLFRCRSRWPHVTLRSGEV